MAYCMKCPFCGKHNVEYMTTSGYYGLVCDCGLSSRLFKSQEEAHKWFYTRNGVYREPKPRPKITVSSPFSRLKDETL